MKALLDAELGKHKAIAPPLPLGNLPFRSGGGEKADS